MEGPSAEFWSSLFRWLKAERDAQKEHGRGKERRQNPTGPRVVPREWSEEHVRGETQMTRKSTDLLSERDSNHRAPDHLPPPLRAFPLAPTVVWCCWEQWSRPEDREELGGRCPVHSPPRTAPRSWTSYSGTQEHHLPLRQPWRAPASASSLTTSTASGLTAPTALPGLGEPS